MNELLVLNEFIAQLQDLAICFSQLKCNNNCNECILGKQFSDYAENKNMCDILIDTYIYLKDNDLLERDIKGL